MNGINKKHSKLIALLMVFIMVFTMIPTTAFAAEETTIYTGSNWPYSGYYVQTLSLSGAEVSYINGTDVYLDYGIGLALKTYDIDHLPCGSLIHAT